MPTYLFVGTEPRDYPSSDGLHPSFTVQPGDHIDADDNPDPARFDPVGGQPGGNPQPTNPTVTDTDDPEPATPEV